MAFKKWVFGTRLSQQITEQNDNWDNVDKELSALTYAAGRTNIGTSDLNSLTKSGAYIQSFNAEALIQRNYPVAAAGVLEVINQEVMVLQKYYTYTLSDIFVRIYYANKWSSWKKLSWGGGN